MHRVAVLCLDGLVAFDLTAPSQVFLLAAKPGGEPLYEVSVCTPHGGPVRTTSGFEVEPRAPAPRLCDGPTPSCSPAMPGSSIHRRGGAGGDPRRRPPGRPG